MAFLIKVDDKEDFNWLRRLITKWNVQAKDNTASYVEFIERFQRLHDSFELAIEVKDAYTPEESESQVSGKGSAKEKKLSSKAGKTAPDKAERGSIKKLCYCKNHPTYTAVRIPRTECETCWESYTKLHPMTAKMQREKFDRKRATVK